MLVEFPSLLCNHAFYAVIRHAKFSSQSGEVSIFVGKAASNFSYLIDRELTRWVSFSRQCSALVRRIVGILLVSSKPKMARVHTRRVVSLGTIMEHKKPTWYWPEVDNPTSSVCHDLTTASVALSEIPISSFVSVASPQPAAIRFVDLRPKPCRERFRKTLRSQVLRSNLDHSSVSTPFGLQAQRRFPLTMIAGGLKEDQAIYAQS